MPGPHSPEEPEIPPSRWAHRLWLWIPLVLAAVVLLTSGVSRWHARSASSQVRSIAVLPFTDLSEQKLDWFSAGFTEEVIDALARVPGLQVAARASAFEFQGKPRDLAQIGRQLGVAAVLDGSIRKAGDRVLLTVQMKRTADGYALWSQTFDRPARAAFSIPTEIAAALARRIQLRPAIAPSKAHPPSQQAYDAYLQGRYSFNQPEPEALDQAAAHLEDATRLDPGFAPAWAWLSIVQEYRVDGGMARPNQAMPGSRDAAERAVALNPDCADAHLALGIVKLQYDWDWPGAKQEFDRGLRQNPGSALALNWRGHWFETQGLMDAAISEMQRALVLDPLSDVIRGDLAADLLAANQPEHALPLAQKALEGYLKDVRTPPLAGMLFLLEGRERWRPTAQMSALLAAYVAAQNGEPAAAEHLLDGAEDLPADLPVPAAAYAQLAGAVRNWDRVFSWIEEAHGDRDVRLPYLRMSPNMPKSDPRFADFLAAMNLPPEK